MANAHVVLLSIALLSMFLGLGAVIAGAVGDSWYKDASGYRIGLWKTCIPNVGGVVCSARKSTLFRFESGTNLDFDIILVALINSAANTLISIFLVICMFCCQRSPCAWKCCAVLVSVITLSGALSAFGAVGYNEYIGKDVYKIFDHGWSNIITWVGALLQLFGSIFAYILICVGPDNRAEQGFIIQHGNANQGYELR